MSGRWPRIHLFEWNDQRWFPQPLRRAETEYLATALALTRPFRELAPTIAALLDDTGTDTVIDLASGGAGPWRQLAPAIAACRGGRSPAVVLTDWFPNDRAPVATAIRYEPAPVDARAVPERLHGVRTMFDALHHLRPADARAVLVDAHARRAPIVIAEAVSRRAAAVLGMVLVPLLVLLVTPLVRPWSFVRLVCTYVVPILPLVILWDGVVSCLRAYRPDELRTMTAGLTGYRWDIDEHVRRGQRITYLIGQPDPT